MVLACGGAAVMTAWALHLKCSTQVVALLGALPFLAQLLQVPGAWLTSRFGARPVALVMVGLSRQMFLPLVALPFLPISTEAKQVVLVASAAAHHAFGILCNNAWVTWMGALVPGRLRGRYFGWRTSVCTFASAASALCTGLVLDGGRAAGFDAEVLAAVSLVACVAGATGTYLMSLKHAPEGAVARPAASAWTKPLADARTRRFLAYLLAWHGAVGLTAPFFGVYLLRDLKLTFAWMAMHGTVLALARMVVAPLWGRQVDRAGARWVLAWCSLGLAFGPLLWAFASPDRVWPVVADAILGGVFLAGHGIASFALPLSLMPDGDRPRFHAVFAMCAGAAFAAASLVGSVLADGTSARSGLPAVFLVSAFVRFLAAALAWRVEREASAPAVVPVSVPSP